MLYVYDKIIAGSKILRVPEWILHMVEISGGSLGALAAQKVLHHKTAKRSFQLVFWCIFVLQVTVFAIFYTKLVNVIRLSK